MIATIRSATLLGVQGRAVTVEVHAGNGLPGLTMVGMPDESCREARDRVRAAVLSSGLTWPSTRITVNLAPTADRKVGSGLDLAIAVGVLVATNQIQSEAVTHLGFIGELGLDGSIRAVPGAAPMVMALDAAITVVAADNQREAQVATVGEVRPVGDLRTLHACLSGVEPWPEHRLDHDVGPCIELPDLADVRGQPVARLALEVAAAGGHHLLLVGPPGAGKTMLARRLPGLLPPLDPRTSIEATMVHSAAGVALPTGGLVTQSPFRAPHHSTSLIALVGGGTQQLRPGEVSMCHGGVLFLDEMGEFPASVLDALRQPLEDGVVRVARARASATLPARFLLVGATNPCPCGGGQPGACICDDGARTRYLRRLSGPLLDRFDLRVVVERPDVDDLVGRAVGQGESSVVVAERVAAARRRAFERSGSLNASLGAEQLDQFAPLTTEAAALLRIELERFRLTGRGYHRVRRVARTLADVHGDDDPIGVDRVAEALALRARVGRTSPGVAA